MMELAQVGVHRNGRAVLDGVQLQVLPGELWGVVGPNGGGKSSLLLAMAGLLAPARGEVRLLGERLSRWSREDLSLRIGFLPQSQHMAFPYTVREFVEMGRTPWLRRYGKDRKRDEAAIGNAVAAMGLGELAERTMVQLSGGEQQRACLAQVLAQETPLLLLDEPLAHLDLVHQTMLLRRLREQARQGQAVVVTLHDLSLAWRCCDRLLVTGGGEATAFAVQESPELEARLRACFGLRFRFDATLGPVPAEMILVDERRP